MSGNQQSFDQSSPQVTQRHVPSASSTDSTLTGTSRRPIQDLLPIETNYINRKKLCGFARLDYDQVLASDYILSLPEAEEPDYELRDNYYVCSFNDTQRCPIDTPVVVANQMTMSYTFNSDFRPVIHDDGIPTLQGIHRGSTYFTPSSRRRATKVPHKFRFKYDDDIHDWDSYFELSVVKRAMAQFSKVPMRHLILYGIQEIFGEENEEMYMTSVQHETNYSLETITHGWAPRGYCWAAFFIQMLSFRLYGLESRPSLSFASLMTLINLIVKRVVSRLETTGDSAIDELIRSEFPLGLAIKPHVSATFLCRLSTCFIVDKLPSDLTERYNGSYLIVKDAYIAHLYRVYGAYSSKPTPLPTILPFDLMVGMMSSTSKLSDVTYWEDFDAMYAGLTNSFKQYTKFWASIPNMTKELKSLEEWNLVTVSIGADNLKKWGVLRTGPDHMPKFVATISTMTVEAASLAKLRFAIAKATYPILYPYLKQAQSEYINRAYITHETVNEVPVPINLLDKPIDDLPAKIMFVDFEWVTSNEGIVYPYLVGIGTRIKLKRYHIGGRAPLSVLDKLISVNASFVNMTTHLMIDGLSLDDIFERLNRYASTVDAIVFKDGHSDLRIWSPPPEVQIIDIGVAKSYTRVKANPKILISTDKLRQRYNLNHVVHHDTISEIALWRHHLRMIPSARGDVVFDPEVFYPGYCGQAVYLYIRSTSSIRFTLEQGLYSLKDLIAYSKHRGLPTEPDAMHESIQLRADTEYRLTLTTVGADPVFHIAIVNPGVSDEFTTLCLNQRLGSSKGFNFDENDFPPIDPTTAKPTVMNSIDQANPASSKSITDSTKPTATATQISMGGIDATYVSPDAVKQVVPTQSTTSVVNKPLGKASASNFNKPSNYNPRDHYNRSANKGSKPAPYDKRGGKAANQQRQADMHRQANQAIGQQLYNRLQPYTLADTGEVIGMLIDLDYADLLEMTRDRQMLNDLTNEALDLLGKPHVDLISKEEYKESKTMVTYVPKSTTSAAQSEATAKTSGKQSQKYVDVEDGWEDGYDEIHEYYKGRLPSHSRSTSPMDEPQFKRPGKPQRDNRQKACYLNNVSDIPLNLDELLSLKADKQKAKIIPVLSAYFKDLCAACAGRLTHSTFELGIPAISDLVKTNKLASRHTDCQVSKNVVSKRKLGKPLKAKDLRTAWETAVTNAQPYDWSEEPEFLTLHTLDRGRWLKFDPKRCKEFCCPLAFVWLAAKNQLDYRVMPIYKLIDELLSNKCDYKDKDIGDYVSYFINCVKPLVGLLDLPKVYPWTRDQLIDYAAANHYKPDIDLIVHTLADKNLHVSAYYEEFAMHGQCDYTTLDQLLGELSSAFGNIAFDTTAISACKQMGLNPGYLAYSILRTHRIPVDYEGQCWPSESAEGIWTIEDFHGDDGVSTLTYLRPKSSQSDRTQPKSVSVVPDKVVALDAAPKANEKKPRDKRFIGCRDELIYPNTLFKCGARFKSVIESRFPHALHDDSFTEKTTHPGYRTISQAFAYKRDLYTQLGWSVITSSTTVDDFNTIQTQKERKICFYDVDPTIFLGQLVHSQGDFIVFCRLSTNLTAQKFSLFDFEGHVIVENDKFLVYPTQHSRPHIYARYRLPEQWDCRTQQIDVYPIGDAIYFETQHVTISRVTTNLITSIYDVVSATVSDPISAIHPDVTDDYINEFLHMKARLTSVTNLKSWESMEDKSIFYSDCTTFVSTMMKVQLNAIELTPRIHALIKTALRAEIDNPTPYAIPLPQRVFNYVLDRIHEFILKVKSTKVGGLCSLPPIEVFELRVYKWTFKCQFQPGSLLHLWFVLSLFMMWYFPTWYNVSKLVATVFLFCVRLVRGCYFLATTLDRSRFVDEVGVISRAEVCWLLVVTLMSLINLTYVVAYVVRYTAWPVSRSFGNYFRKCLDHWSQEISVIAAPYVRDYNRRISDFRDDAQARASVLASSIHARAIMLVDAVRPKSDQLVGGYTTHEAINLQYSRGGVYASISKQKLTNLENKPWPSLHAIKVSKNVGRSWRDIVTLLKSVPVDDDKIRRLRRTTFMLYGQADLDSIPRMPLNHPLYALWAFKERHLRPKVIPDRTYVSQFAAYVEAFDKIYPLTLIVTSFEEYLKGVHPKKRKKYLEGYLSFMSHGRLITSVICFGKGDEKQNPDGLEFDDPDALKCRNIFDPSSEVKAILGWYAHNLLLSFKAHPVIGRSFIHGVSTEELERHLEECIRHIIDPVCITFDSAQHDSHQSMELLDAVDSYYVSTYNTRLCALMGLGPSQAKAILSALLSKFTTVKLRDTQIKSRRKYLAIIRMVGTVYSGHPLRTTVFNTARQILSIRFSIDTNPAAIIPWFFNAQAGDDSLNFCTRSKTQFARLRLHRSFSVGQTPYGLGMLFKNYTESDIKFDFLSKIGTITRNMVTLIRMPHRFVRTGRITSADIPDDEYCKSIHQQFNSWATDVYGARAFTRPELGTLTIKDERPVWDESKHQFDPSLKRLDPLLTLLEVCNPTCYARTKLYSNQPILVGGYPEMYSRLSSFGLKPKDRVGSIALICTARWGNAHNSDKASGVFGTKAARNDLHCETTPTMENALGSYQPIDILKPNVELPVSVVLGLRRHLDEATTYGNRSEIPLFGDMDKNGNQNNNNNDNKGKQGRGSNRRYNNNGARLNDMKKIIEAIGKQFKKELANPKQAVESFKQDKNLRSDIQRAVNTPARGKLSYLEKLVGEKFMSGLVPDYNGLKAIEKMDYAATVFADDLGILGSMFGSSPTQILGSLAVEYGPKLIDWIYSHAKQRRSTKPNNIKSHGSGVGFMSTPVGDDSLVLSNSKVEPIYSMKSYDSVNLDFIANLFCPESYSAPLPDAFGPNVCTATATGNITLNTDASGNAVCYAIMLGATQGTVVASYALANNAIAGACNPTTGAITAPVYNAGPFNSQLANLNYFRATSTSIRIVPNLSATNNSGSILLAYNTSCIEGIGAAPAIPNTSLFQYPYLHIAAVNGTKEMRQIRIPHSITDTELSVASWNLSNMFGDDTDLDHCAINVIGGPVNSSVARIFYTYNIDWIPDDTAMVLHKPKPTPEGPASLACVAALIKRMPHLTQLSLDEAMELGDRIMNCDDASYTGVCSAILKHAVKYKPRPKDHTGFNAVGGGDDAGVSMDEVFLE